MKIFGKMTGSALKQGKAALLSCACLLLLTALVWTGGAGRDKEPAVNEPESSGVPAAQVKDEGPVNYSGLVKLDGSRSCEQFQNGSLDIKAFDEAFLENCPVLVEGEITDIYVKDYDFTVSDDKFGPGGSLRYRPSTVVYSLRVDKSWLGEFEEGDIVTVEDQLFFPDEVFALKEGHSYVIPLEYFGDKIWTYGSDEVLSGDISRESPYGTLYPYHPQIERTERGYIVSDDWKTLAGGRRVVMDLPLGPEGEFYRDKMTLVDPKTFVARMELLIK